MVRTLAPDLRASPDRRRGDAHRPGRAIATRAGHGDRHRRRPRTPRARGRLEPARDTAEPRTRLDSGRTQVAVPRPSCWRGVPRHRPREPGPGHRDREPGPRPDRRLRAGRRPRVRWRPRRAAAARLGRRPAGLGDGGPVPRGVRRRPGAARAAVLVRRLPRRGVDASGRAASRGGLLALVAIFLPGALLVLAALPVVGWLRGRPGVESALAGVNAAVVGILAAALISPVMTGSLTSPLAVVVAAAGVGLLLVARVPPLAWSRAARGDGARGVATRTHAGRGARPEDQAAVNIGGHEERRTIREGTGPCGVRPAAGPVTGAAAALNSVVP